LHLQLDQHHARKPSTYSHENMGKFGGDYRGGVGKVACWSTKAAISLKHVKIRKSYYGEPIGSHKRSFERYHPRPPAASPSPRLGVHNPTPKMQSLLSQEQLKLRTVNLADTFTGSIRTQAHEKFWRKKERGRIQGRPKFFEYFLSPQKRVRTSNLASIFTGSMRTKAPQKFGRKGSVGVSRDCSIVFSTPQFFQYPLLSQERVKLRTSNFVRTFLALIGRKPINNFGNSSRGHSQGLVPKIVRALA